MAEQVQLKLVKRTDEGFFGKAISNIGKAVYSSGSSLYTILITTKRSSLLKHYSNYKTVMEVVDENKRNSIIAKYQKVYENYLNTLEKYITETIYTKMQKRVSNLEEEKIMSTYYEINALKGIDHVEYKNRLQMLLLNMEWASISAKQGKFLEKYKDFYLYNMEELYKASMRHSAILLANAKEGDQDKYDSVYNLIEDYIKNILPLFPETKDYTQVIEDYKKHVLTIDSFAKKEYNDLRRKLVLLGFGKTLFVYSLPTIAAEQCYLEIIRAARTYLANYFIEADKYEAYQVLLDAIEEYNDNILIKKSYWKTPNEEEQYKKFNEKWSELKKLARIDYDDFKKQREILFVKNDLKYMKKEKIKLDEVRNYYRDRMLQLDALRKLANKYQTKLGIWLTKRRQKADEVVEEITLNNKVETDEIIESSNEAEKIESKNSESAITENISMENINTETSNVENMIKDNQ